MITPDQITRSMMKHASYELQLEDAICAAINAAPRELLEQAGDEVEVPILDVGVETLNWTRAKKTKGIMAKSMVNLLVDRTVATKFLLDTLEAKEPIDPANIFCIGEAGDAWQQTAKALLKKYDITDIDGDGWMICSPKPDNEVQCCCPVIKKIHYIKAQWGEQVNGMTVQRLTPGDFVCRQPDDHSDVWVVNENLFKNTYEIL